jgi:glutathione S-transferase-like protein
MKLYVCWGTWTGATPWPFRRADVHPRGVAHQALREAGYEPEVIRCFGWEALPAVFNLTPGRRKVKELTGGVTVPVLVTDDGRVVSDSKEIASWARAHARTDADG